MINQNKEITQEIKKQFGLSEMTGYPRRISEAIIPVLPVNKKYCNVARTTADAATIYTTPATQDFYLTNAWGFISNTATTAVERKITVTIGGVDVVIWRLAQDDVLKGDSLVLNFQYPLKLDRNTNIVVAGSGNQGGSAHASVGIMGYTEEVTGD
jgi:hypothetical protein